MRKRYCFDPYGTAAVVIAFQLFGKMIPYNNFIVGPVVNAALLVATARQVCGRHHISVIAPLVSAFTNKAPLAPLCAYSPCIIGNIIIVLAFWLFRKRSNCPAKSRRHLG